MFLWRLAKHSLPTNDVRCNRKMADSNACGLRGMEDSRRHSFLECSISRSIWELVNEELEEHLIATMEPSAKQWLFVMIESLSHQVFVTLAVTLWLTW